MITNPNPMELAMPGHNELPPRIPEWDVKVYHDRTQLVIRRVPSITLSCGYQLQFPEYEPPSSPIRERYRSRNKYANPHQSVRECTRRLTNG